MMPFEDALHVIKQGGAVTRTGWAEGITVPFICMMPALHLPPFNTQGTNRKVNDRTAKWIGEDAPLNCEPYIAMYTRNCLWQPGWTPSQQDMFAIDWRVIADVSKHHRAGPSPQPRA